MGIAVDRVIGDVRDRRRTRRLRRGIYCRYINTSISDRLSERLYAFTAAVLGGIGNIPGAVLGGLAIGMVRAFSDQYIGAQWQPAVLFGILILILVFRPAGLLGAQMREKV